MDNKDEILTALEEFGRVPSETIPSTLEQYLSRIAATGITLFPWLKVKPLLVHKLDAVLKEFHKRAPVDNPTPCPNVEDVKFDEMQKRLHAALEQFSGIPFTVQRLCELLTCPMKHYKLVDKFMRGVEKNLAVVTTVDCFGNRIVSESKSLVNGLDSSADQSLVDGVAGSTSFNSATSSPNVPTAPMNSPANARGGSWFSSLTSVVESPSSYPNWRATANVSSGDASAAAAADGSWPVLTLEPDDGDDDLEPPAKRRSLGRLSQSPSDRNDASPGAAPPVTVIAPLLGQLLSSVFDGDAGGAEGSQPADKPQQPAVEADLTAINSTDEKKSDVNDTVSCETPTGTSIEPTDESSESKSASDNVAPSPPTLDESSSSSSFTTTSSSAAAESTSEAASPESSSVDGKNVDTDENSSSSRVESSEDSVSETDVTEETKSLVGSQDEDAVVTDSDAESLTSVSASDSSSAVESEVLPPSAAVDNPIVGRRVDSEDAADVVNIDVKPRTSPAPENLAAQASGVKARQVCDIRLNSLERETEGPLSTCGADVDLAGRRELPDIIGNHAMLTVSEVPMDSS